MNQPRQPNSLPDSPIALSRLPHGAEVLVGREADVARLDTALWKPNTHVVAIIAWGGVGKTALEIEWMTRLARRGWRGVERYFDWSFYSQGTRDQATATSDQFIAAALAHFDDPDPQAGSPYERGDRLARLVAQRPTVLIMDGLEPLQYGPGPLQGRLTDPAVAALLKGLAQRPIPGLCVVSSREPLADLDSFHGKTVDQWPLEHLSDEAGARLLHQAGANRAGAAAIGPDDAGLRTASHEVGGHALTLHLMGRYLALAHDGDVRKRDLLEFTEADAVVEGGHAFRVLAAYERWLLGDNARRNGDAGTRRASEGERMLAVLRLMGLFDRPANPGCLSELRTGPAIPGLTDALVGISESHWNIAVNRLVEIGLLTRVAHEPPRVRGYEIEIARQALMSGIHALPEPAEFAPPAVARGDALQSHPLVRAYFAQQLRERPDAWRTAHRRLFEHLQRRVPYWPEELSGLQPLYQAVAHGCQAGLQQKACEDVYDARILRGTGDDGFYSTKKLVATGADLGAVACFFDRPWSRVSPNLSPAYQAWLLNEAATLLRALGRLTEAVEPMRAAFEMAVQQENWKSAAARASNLSELELTLGEVSAAVADGERSVTFADRSREWVEIRDEKTTHADALNQGGRRDDAQRLFRVAEAMQAQRQSQYPRLYSLLGFRYCDLLLSTAERAAWQALLECGDLSPLSHFAPPPGSLARPTAKESGDASPHSKACADVTERATQTLEWAERNGAPILDVALDHLTLARAQLYGALLHVGENLRDSQPVLERPTYVAARRHLPPAVDGLHASGNMDHLPRGLLTLSWFRFVEGDVSGCQAALAEAWEIAERGPMPLFQADIHLTRARLFRDRSALAEARRLIEKHGYHRRDEELADAEAAARDWPRAASSKPVPQHDTILQETSTRIMTPTISIHDVRGHVDFAVITIREDEFEAVLQRFAPRQAVTGGKQLYEFCRFSTAAGIELGVAIVRALEQGPSAAQSVARDVIDDLDPGWLILVGIAGGVADNEFSLGDVLLASRLHDFSVSAALEGRRPEYQQTGGPMHPDVERLLAALPAWRERLGDWNSAASIGRAKPIVEVPQGLNSSSFYGPADVKRRVRESLARHFAGDTAVRPPLFRVGPAVTAGVLVKDTALLTQWQESARHLTHVEMEAGGVYQASRHGGRRDYPLLCVRGISDIVGFRRAPEWTAYSCHTAAAFLNALIRSGAVQVAVSRPQMDGLAPSDSSIDDQLRRDLQQLAASDWRRFLSDVRIAFNDLARLHDNHRGEGTSTLDCLFAQQQWRTVDSRNEVEIDGVLLSADPVGSAELPSPDGPRKTVFLLRSAPATQALRESFVLFAEVTASVLPRPQVDSALGEWKSSTALAEWLCLLWMRRSGRYGQVRRDGWLWNDIFRASVELVDVLTASDSRQHINFCAKAPIQPLDIQGPRRSGPLASVDSLNEARPPTTSSGAVAIWQEKLEYLLKEQAIAGDPDQKFRLTKLIAEARQKIAELGDATR